MASYPISYSNPESLTELSSIVERTLIDTGRLFRKSGSMPSRTHLQRSLPLYHDSFQNALDNLSEQIFIAKAYLERDYDALKAKSAASQLIEDVAMSDTDQQVKPEIQPSPVEKVEMDTEFEPEPKSEEVVSASQPPAAQIKHEIQSGDNDILDKKDHENNAAAGPSFSGNNEDLTFDSVLNDTGGTNDFELSLDFNDDDMGNQAFLSGSNFTAPGTAGADKLNPNQPEENTTNVPTGGGAFDVELQKTEGDNGNFTGEEFMGPAESNFDDLFMDTDNFGENGGEFNQLEGDSLMNVNELDDNWFN